MEKNIGTNRIRFLREQKNLRQSDVAKATRIDQRSLSNYETGKTQPDAYVIVTLANFFNVTTDYLLGLTDMENGSYESIVQEIEKIKSKLTDIQKNLNSL